MLCADQTVFASTHTSSCADADRRTQPVDAMREIPTFKKRPDHVMALHTPSKPGDEHSGLA